MTAAEDLDNGWSARGESARSAATANGTSIAPLPLTGNWRGSYDYLGGAGLTSSFTARIEDDGTHLSGAKIEPERHGGSAPSRASIVGLRESTTVKFTAFGIPDSVAFNSIDYVGIVSEDGNTIRGMWTFQIFDGPFEMHRLEVCKNTSDGAWVGRWSFHGHQLGEVDFLNIHLILPSSPPSQKSPLTKWFVICRREPTENP